MPTAAHDSTSHALEARASVRSVVTMSAVDMINMCGGARRRCRVIDPETESSLRSISISSSYSRAYESGPPLLPEVQRHADQLANAHRAGHGPSDGAAGASQVSAKAFASSLPHHLPCEEE